FSGRFHLRRLALLEQGHQHRLLGSHSHVGMTISGSSTSEGRSRYEADLKTPCPIQIVLAHEDDHNFELDEEALENILLQEHIKDLNIVVVSVAGAFRKGKSFLLDFMLRYMYNKVSS
uniref:GB1/RHD3-type G domain-containing protein n=1 Tax=Chrysemys picta bellii TaxID=8478 RepID=A0A8C3I1C3_CHRPI